MNHSTPAWRFQTWAAFALSFGITAVGILWLPVSIWPKAFLAIGFLFTVAQCFTLAKTIRDDQDADLRGTPDRERAYRDASVSR